MRAADEIKSQLFAEEKCNILWAPKSNQPKLNQRNFTVDVGFAALNVVHIFGDISDVVADSFAASGNEYQTGVCINIFRILAHPHPQFA